ncbi:MAG: hypothetical protein ACLFSB_10370 [Chitinispirillaceae bacterium]
MSQKAYWSTREYVFAAITVVVLFVVSSIIIPFTLPLRIPGLANVVVALFSNCFIVIALLRLKRPGSLLLVKGIYGSICLLISPVITGFVLAGTIVGEAVGSLVFKGYGKAVSAVAAAVIYQMVAFPAAMFISFKFTPERYHTIVWWVWIVAEVAIFTTALISSLIGVRIARELARAGKLDLENV